MKVSKKFLWVRLQSNEPVEFDLCNEVRKRVLFRSVYRNWFGILFHAISPNYLKLNLNEHQHLKWYHWSQVKIQPYVSHILCDIIYIILLLYYYLDNILLHFIQKTHIPIKIIMVISFRFHFGWNCFPWCFGMIICFFGRLLVFIISIVSAAQVAINTKNGLFGNLLCIERLNWSDLWFSLSYFTLI